MLILVVVAVTTLVFLVGAGLAFIFSRADRVVTSTRTEMVAEEKAYNPGVTMGHRIKPAADPGEQLEQARREAARQAAALPRGANSRVGVGVTSSVTASKALKEDPITAVKIAQFHGWDGARSGIPAGGVPVAAAAAAPVAAATVAAAPAEVTVVAGRDYVEIPITDGMSPEEVRKARAANAKAKSAAMKAAKAAGGGPAAIAAPVVAAGAVAAAPATAPVVVTGVEPPVLIEITDSMSPEDVRKARVANSKAQAAYNKALKAAGGTPGAVAEAAPVAAAAGLTASGAPVASPAAPVIVGVEPPKLIEITDSMSPDDVRKARIANSKAQAAYNKALKEAGYDPSAAAPAAAAATPAPVATAAPGAPAPTATSAPAVSVGGPPGGIEPPKLIEITPEMPADAVRRARIENSKTMAAYNKALKAAGIDPATVGQ